MYKKDDIQVLHLEITSKCQASCPMCARNIQGGINNPFIKLNEITLEKFMKWFTIDFIKQLKKLYICGNLGDPIIAKDTLEIFSYLRKNNPDILLSMNTNGSARSVDWWKSLAHLDVKVRFGIDGLKDTHSLYRVGTEFEKIISNVKSFVEAGGYAIWDMLVFDHNKNQIEECKKLSEELGVKEFFSKNTSRFKDDKLIVLNKEGKTTHTLYPTKKSKSISNRMDEYIFKSNNKKKEIKCKVQPERSLYIAANGNVVPCCWLDMEWKDPNNTNRINYMDLIGVYMNLNNLTLQEIFDSGFFKKIETTWWHKPLFECSKQCGEVDRFNDQYK